MADLGDVVDRTPATKPLETSFVSLNPNDVSFRSTDSLMRPKPAWEAEAIQACYIGLGAMMGCLLRIAMAQLFGEECANPGTIGWLAAAAPLCVTKDLETSREGGIVFSDLPANILGSFIMGLFQSGAVLGLTVPVAVAWLAPHHSFQKMSILHKAVTTGFCGSLTTFSSWNSEMVVMIFGTGNNRQTQVWSALFGYIIGMETALGSFACGKSVAVWLHRRVNPGLSDELNAAKIRRRQGVPINGHLPQLERRFLPQLAMGPQYDVSAHLSLLKWRQSTESARRIDHPLLPLLTDIETTVLAKHNVLAPQTESMARAEGWDVDALLEWSSMPQRPDPVPERTPNQKRWFQLPFAAGMLAIAYVLLFFGLAILYEEDAPTITYRTMVYAMVFAPFGANLRWKLSKWNGTYTADGWTWLPLGTLTANLMGTVIGAFAVAGELNLATELYNHHFTSFWVVGTLRAIKLGFAGCLTTVSTFASEVVGFMHGGTEHGYPYIMVTLVISCALGCIVYGLTMLSGPW